MRNISAKKKAIIAITIIYAATIAFTYPGKAETLDFGNSYAGYVRTDLPYEKLIVPVKMNMPH